MELLKNNIENFKTEAAEYFKNENDHGLGLPGNFKYQVATNLDLYEIDNVSYYPNDFEKSLKALYDNNLGTQLTEVFKKDFGFNLKEYIKSTGVDHIHFYTHSDVGSLKIGNKDFTILIPNSFGDGTTKVFIVEERIKIPLKYFTMVKGEIAIYSYDCGNEVSCKIDGEYQIYSEDGTIVFCKTV